MVVEILKLTFRTVIMIRNLIGLSVHNVMNNRNVGKSKKQLWSFINDFIKCFGNTKEYLVMPIATSRCKQ